MMNEFSSKSVAGVDQKFSSAVDIFVQAVKDFKSGVGLNGAISVTKDYGNINYNKFNPSTWSNTDNISKLVKENNLKSGQYFKYQGKTYAVKSTSGGWPTLEEVKMAMGGYISGSGNGTSDSIPAMLSNGEYVVSAKAVQAAGIPMLDRINKMGRGGPVYDVPAYSMGGRVKYNAGGLAGSSNALYNINVTLNGTDLNPNDVAKAIDNQMRLREAMNGRDRKA
jgi:hypothetical protein